MIDTNIVPYFIALKEDSRSPSGMHESYVDEVCTSHIAYSTLF